MNEITLKQLLAEGEGYRLEFKESKTNLDKEFSAFANSSGGFILLGVKDDTTIKGIKITNKLKSQIQDIADNCDPSIKVILFEVKNVLVVEVREGEDKPYRAKEGYYGRFGPNSRKLTRNETAALMKSVARVNCHLA